MHFETYGYGFWALELKRTNEFIGLTRLAHVLFEAALAVMNFAKEFLSLSEIVSFTVPQNLRSRNVMEKIGMQRD